MAASSFESSSDCFPMLELSLKDIKTIIIKIIIVAVIQKLKIILYFMLFITTPVAIDDC